MLTIATRIVSDYGNILNQTDSGLYGHPVSCLPYDKERIREAILTVFEQLGQLRPDVRHGLIHGFVYLSQFVPDDEAGLIARGQDWLAQNNPADTPAPEFVHESLRLINQIKANMESAMQEIERLEKSIMESQSG